MPRRPAPDPFGPAVAASLLAGCLWAQGLASLPGPSAWLGWWLAGLALWWPATAWRPLGAFLLGLALACGHGAYSLSRQLPPALSGSVLLVEGRVSGLPVRTEDRQRFEFRVERGEGPAAVLAGRRLQLAWFDTPGQAAPDLAPGSRWRLPVKLRPPRGVVNPGGFDFERRALERRLAATGHVADPAGARALAGAAGLDALRGRLSDAIGAAVPGPGARFVQALALGDTRGLDDRDWEILRATGLTHLIAISGFHVGLVAGFGTLLARLAWRVLPGLGRRWPRPLGVAAMALLAALAYTALAGFALPTVRTALMIGAVALARLLRRPQGTATSLALATIAVLLVDPLSVLAPGFWLSYLGVAWLLWCLPAGPGQGWLRPYLGAQGVAMLGLLPIGAWFFAQVSLPGPLVNLVGIPWISLGVVPLALLGLGLHPAWPEAAALAWRAAATLMDWLWRGLEAVAAWPGSLAWLPEPTLPAVALALAGVFWLLLPRAVAGKALACLLLLPLLWPVGRRPAQGEAELWLLDVGQGLSMLVLTENHALLFDAGPAPPRGMDFGEAAVLPALRALGVARLDGLVASHGDNDHAGGVPAVLAALPAGERWGPRGWAPPGWRACEAGQGWQWDGVRFTWLHPTPFFPYLRNDSSCVLRIEAGGASALLPGDIGRHVEARLAKLPAAQLRSELLVVPHHGSDTSSSLDFLAAVRPRLALLPVGHDNRFGLPRPIVLARYERYGAPVLDSAGSGAIRLRLGAGGVQVLERLRPDRPRYWRHAPVGVTGYAIGGPPTTKVMRAGTDQGRRLGDGADRGAGDPGAGHHPGAVLEPAAQGSAAAGPGRGGP
ncbi:DNA internalization-related competence protein ComEC/Rec2 [Arenimonas caeni]|uniref:DNA internalization-related competence protein ComEC/Rec2 n=1 Tax=Arenimonas caeni TaxID=2058085 RepID=A0A2P6MB98_9GAMM|nr:DNA internalization-related competence protein ComEC/Rec2 [Arenimonas caeni]PRH83267.1 DNA internalization-related competence protein ComEC/Rec2 [Arenimonas caeni]